jgi:hypothetical protein
MVGFALVPRLALFFPKSFSNNPPCPCEGMYVLYEILSPTLARAIRKF